MTQNLTKKLKKKKGFTLIELIIVVAIIAILAGLAIPKLMGTQDNAKKKADIANAKVIHDAAVKLLTEDKFTGNDWDIIIVTDDDGLGENGKILFDELQTHPVPKYNSATNTEFSISIAPTSKDIKVYVGGKDDKNEVYPKLTKADYATK